MLLLLGVLQVDEATQPPHICRGHRWDPCRIPGCWVSLCEPLWAQACWFCRLSCDSLDRSDSHNSSALSLAGSPELHLMFDCGSASVASVAGWRLSEDNWVRHQSTSVAEYCYASLHCYCFSSSRVSSYPKPPGHLACSGPSSVRDVLTLPVRVLG